MRPLAVNLSWYKDCEAQSYDLFVDYCGAQGLPRKSAEPQEKVEDFRKRIFDLESFQDRRLFFFDVVDAIYFLK